MSQNLKRLKNECVLQNTFSPNWRITSLGSSDFQVMNLQFPFALLHTFLTRLRLGDGDQNWFSINYANFMIIFLRALLVENGLQCVMTLYSIYTRHLWFFKATMLMQLFLRKCFSAKTLGPINLIVSSLIFFFFKDYYEFWSLFGWILSEWQFQGEERVAMLTVNVYNLQQFLTCKTFAKV